MAKRRESRNIAGKPKRKSEKWKNQKAERTGETRCCNSHTDWQHGGHPPDLWLMGGGVAWHYTLVIIPGNIFIAIVNWDHKAAENPDTYKRFCFLSANQCEATQIENMTRKFASEASRSEKRFKLKVLGWSREDWRGWGKPVAATVAATVAVC